MFIIRFEMGFSKNNVFFDDRDDAIAFAKHIKTLKGVKGVSLHSVEYDYETTVEL